jgi:Cdc6-like AAA superfamily ATPase
MTCRLFRYRAYGGKPLFGDYEGVFLEDSPRGACLIGGLGVYNRLVEKRNLLIAGLPDTGKTTLVTRLIDRFKDLKVVGESLQSSNG